MKQRTQTLYRNQSAGYRSLKEELLSARASDLHDVGYHVLRIMMGTDEQSYMLPDHEVRKMVGFPV